MNKVRRTLNISLQSKKYLDPINNIVQEWEKKGLNISTETCEALLIMHKMNNYNTIKQILDISNLLESIIEIYNVDNINVDDFLSEIISINNQKLSNIILRLNQGKLEQEKDTFIREKQEKKEIVEEKVESEIKKEVKEINTEVKREEIRINKEPERKVSYPSKKEEKDRDISDEDFGIVFNV